MKPKLLLCLALVLSGGWFGCLQTNASINVPVVAAPKMRECQGVKTKDLGLWDDVFRFENLDAVILRRGDKLVSYSLVTSDMKKIGMVSDMTGSRIIDGVRWGKHQWLFCQSDVTLPFAVDLSTGQKVPFAIPEVKLPGKYGPAIHAIVNVGAEGGTLIEIRGDSVAGWPRDGNRSLYFWMSLESGKMVKIPTGWDLNYFSADQKRAVFENVSTNAMMYRPWVTVDMATGEVAGELPDQTKSFWSEPTMEFWQTSAAQGRQYKIHLEVWQLRTPRTPARLLHPQPGRGSIDDKFAGLSVNGVDYPLAMTNIGNARCVDAKSAGTLAAFLLEPDGGGRNDLWITQLKTNASPTLLATNSSFEMLGTHRCAWIARNETPATWPEAMVYDAESKTAWNILEGVSPETNTIANSGGGTNRPDLLIHPKPISGYAGKLEMASGIGPMVAVKLVPGFGSTRFSAQVLCLCSSSHMVPAYMIPPPVVRQLILLTAQGERCQIKLPKDENDLVFGRQFWLHNSGKLVVCQSEPPSEHSPQGQFHMIVVELNNRL
jgi:hypothetical protein